MLYVFSTTICSRKKLTEKKCFSDNAVAHNGDYFKDCPAGFDFRRAIFNIIPDHIMRTNGKDGRIWRESTLAVNWLLSTVIQNHPFLQTNQNQMSVSSK